MELKIAKLRSLSMKQKGEYAFDFAQIDNSHYNLISGTLPFIPASVFNSLSFGISSPLQPNSIAQNQPQLLNDIINLLKVLIPKKTHLKKIEFFNLQFSSELIKSLSQILSTSKSIISLSFENVPFGDSALTFFLQVLKLDCLSSLTFLNCNISDNSLNSILEFIDSLKPPKSKFILEHIIISDKLFTKQSYIDEKLYQYRNLYEEEENFLEEEALFLSYDNESSEKQSLIEEEEEDNRSIDEIIKENEIMKNQIKILRNLSNSIILSARNTQMLAIGPGTEHLEEYLIHLTQKMDDLSSIHRNGPK